MEICDVCNQRDARIRLTSEQEAKELCETCYNHMMELELGVNLDAIVQSFSVEDHEGNKRNFNVHRRLDPLGIFLEVQENISHGYRFVVHGELKCNQKELFSLLMDKVIQGINSPSLKLHRFPNGHQQEVIGTDQVIGRVEYDETSNGNTPLIIIDGKPHTWEQLGQMVTSFEGFQMKIKWFDMTEQVK
ncbi:DUF7713 domain-containing protein [Rossellomorea vietnamensis]|uniref:DUF7713 domain-containing protein n=1 Tax=Rossellomorea vietnamensis TaxID=218284 RepID=UPI001E373134|nr:hypothetical protein [Rossellomorea vietnamensis]MCC5803222.1 hypothetical protein [Rossellomorea vietnamensis]